MKKTVCALICSALFLASCGTDAAQSSAGEPSSTGGESSSVSSEVSDTVSDEPLAFDENNIVLTFAALSDIHQNGDASSAAGKKFASALSQLKSGYDLDLMLIAGDMTDSGSEAQIKQFASTVDAVYGDTLPIVYSLGNHDGQGGSTSPLFRSLLPDGYYSADISADTVDAGNRHAVVNGYHFITVETASYYDAGGDCSYSPSTLEWLKTQLAAAAADGDGKPIFVATHPMIYGTAYGSELPSTGTNWYTTALTDIIAEYPQAVTFGGHIHHPLNDERSIMQGKFTSLGCGSVSYMAIEGGYVQTGSGTVPSDAQKYSQGLVVEVDASGYIRFTRMDFFNSAVIKEPWVISPKGAETFLTEYTAERAETNEAPSFGDVTFSKTTQTHTDYRCDIDLTFNAAADDDLVHHYNIEVTSGGEKVASYKWLSGFYLVPDPSLMPSDVTVSLDGLPTGTDIKIAVTAVDSWGAESESAVYEMTTPGELKPQTEKKKAELYASLDFSGSAAADSLGKLKLTSTGASTETGEYTYRGKQYTVPALRIAQSGQALVAEFADISSAEEIRGFMSSGFAVEALYVNNAPSGTQGVVCGTQNGGWGLAESGGKPYFIMSDGSYVSVYAKQNSPAGELTHVVAVYDPDAGELLIYVNGELSAAQAFTGSLKAGEGGTFNRFCIGSDITSGGSAGDFPMSDFAAVAVNIYSGVPDAQIVSDMAEDILK